MRARSVHRRVLAVLVGLLVLVAAGLWALSSPRLQAAGLEPTPPGEADLENGAAMFHAGGCASCHATPGQGDRLRLGGGLALRSPYGVFHVPNISPHPRDGIGAWTSEQFQRAMRAGISPDGRHYYPAFPYTAYQRMSPAHVRDLFAFIGTLEPVAGRAPGHDLRFPYNIRRGVGLWKQIYLDGEVFRADPAQSQEINRGAYLVEALAHCAECHSPRNLAGAIPAELRFSGGPNPEGGPGWVPNITPHPNGIGGWSKGDLVELLTTGFTPEFDSVGGSMAEVVRNTAQLPSTDREAIAEYLLSLPPRPGVQPQRQRGGAP